LVIESIISTEKKEDSKETLKKVDKPIILIVDDNEIINNSTRKLFEILIKEYNLNYQLVLGCDGLDIIKLALEYDKDYNSMIKGIFTDENMDFLKGTDGIKFIRKLEKIKNYQKTKIVSITCHEDSKITDYIIKIGADCVVSKPLTKNILLNTLKKIGLINANDNVHK